LAALRIFFPVIPSAFMKAAQLRLSIYSRRDRSETKSQEPLGIWFWRFLLRHGLRNRETGLVPREFNVLALIKGEERYVFIYDDDSRAELIDALRDQAADPGLTLTWFDAAVLTEKAREQAIANVAKEKPARNRI
jgi:hypothetical protein